MKKLLKHNKLLCCIVLICFCMHVYGLSLASYGYRVEAKEEMVMPLSLAFVQIGKGVFPWNMQPQFSNLEKEETTETSEISTKEELEVTTAILSEDNRKKLRGEAPEEEIPPLEEPEEKLEFIAVEESYFDDALFIGDSRMVGVYEYAGLENATFYAKVSMTIYDLMDSRITTNDEVRDVREGLETNQFGKIYLMVGLNELGTGDTEYFIRAYREVLQEIQTMQPHAIIYIQGIMHVTGELDSQDPIFNNENINERNNALKELANGENVVYIDVNTVYDDVNGNLRSDYTADDVHLLGNCYEPWYQFYLQMGLDLEQQRERR